MSRREEKKPEITAEGSLAPQIGTDTTQLVKGKFDIMMLSKTSVLDKIWIPYFYMIPKKRGGRFARAYAEGYLRVAVSEEGWRVNKLIQMVSGSKGVGSVGELVKKPGVLQRNITDRDWKKKAEEKGATVVE